MKYNFTLLFALLSSFPAISQSYQLGNGGYINSLLNVIEKDIVLINQENDSTLQWLVLDSNLVEQSSRMIATSNRKNSRATDLFTLNDRILYIDQKKEDNTIQLTWYDRKGNIINNNVLHLFPAKLFTPDQYIETLSFNVMQSANKERLLFYQFSKAEGQYLFNAFIVNQDLEVTDRCSLYGSFDPGLEDFSIQVAANSGSFYFLKHDYADNYRLSARFHLWKLNSGMDSVRKVEFMVSERKLTKIYLSENGSQLSISGVSLDQSGNPDNGSILFISYNKDLSNKGVMRSMHFDRKTVKKMRWDFQLDKKASVYEYLRLENAHLLPGGEVQVRAMMIRQKWMFNTAILDSNSHEANWTPGGHYIGPQFVESLPAAGNVAFMQNQMSGNHRRKLTYVKAFDYLLMDFVSKVPALSFEDPKTRKFQYSSSNKHLTNAILLPTRIDNPYYLTVSRNDKQYLIGKANIENGYSLLYSDKKLSVRPDYPFIVTDKYLICFYRDGASKGTGLMKVPF